MLRSSIRRSHVLVGAVLVVHLVGSITAIVSSRSDPARAFTGSVAQAVAIAPAVAGAAAPPSRDPRLELEARLTEAKRSCSLDDCSESHETLASIFAALENGDAERIENTWATATLTRAEHASLPQKLLILTRVSDAPRVDPAPKVGAIEMAVAVIHVPSVGILR